MNIFRLFTTISMTAFGEESNEGLLKSGERVTSGDLLSQLGESVKRGFGWIDSPKLKTSAWPTAE